MPRGHGQADVAQARGSSPDWVCEFKVGYLYRGYIGIMEKKMETTIMVYKGIIICKV